MADIIGDDGPNIITGTTDPDTLAGRGGDDRINGGAGNDVIQGEDGADTLYGGTENDTVSGGAGNDKVYGDAGNDVLEGGAGDDLIVGGAGSDTASYANAAFSSVYGFQNTAAGPVTLFYRGVNVDLAISGPQNTGEGMDTLLTVENLIGSAFDDRLFGSAAANTIEGGAGVDRIGGRGGADVLHGNDGNDIIHANGDFGVGNYIIGDEDNAIDTVFGGAGDDIIAVGARDIADGGDGNDRLIVSFVGRGSGVTIDLSGGAEAALEAASGGSFSNFERYHVTGSNFGDTITGDAGNNEMWGLDGDDILSGGADGLDVLYGGEGDDTLTASAGSVGDVLIGGAGSDIITGGDGGDTLYGVIGVSVATGNTLRTGLEDDGEIDTLNGGAGNDTIYAGLGDNADGGAGTVDVLYVTLQDLAGPIELDLSTGGAAALSLLTGGVYANFERYSVFATNYDDVVLGDAGVNNLWGQSGDDTLFGGDSGDLLGGNDGDDSLFGGNGNDSLYGGAGADVMNGEAGDDTIFVFSGTQVEPFSPGDDQIDGGDGVDTLSFNPTFIGDQQGAAFAVTANVTVNLNITGPQNTGAGVMTIVNVENVVGGQGDDLLIGNAVGNFLWGGDGEDYLIGLDGNDNMFGGYGDDILRGDAGTDVFNGGEGDDRVSFYNLFATQGVVADLRTQTISNDGFGNSETMVSIEGLGGGTRFVDTFHGNDQDNVIIGDAGDFLYGHGGDDFIQFGAMPAVVDGGDGSDQILFSSSRTVDRGDGVGVEQYTTQGVSVDLSTSSVNNDGWGNSGALTSIENVAGSDHDDFIRGDSGDNWLAGRDGDDILVGMDGDDELLGGAGDDLLYGFHGTDTFDGGEGVDRISFYNAYATQGVIADLRSQTITNDGFGFSETMTSIEGLGGGTRFADLFYGNDVDNLILVGGGDTAYGFGGDDQFQVDDAPALIDGGTGVDTITVFTSSRLIDLNSDGVAETQFTTTGVNVNLQTRRLEDGWGNVGVVNSVENLGGSDFADVLTGSNVDNDLWGYEGDDVISGGAGNDDIEGHEGADTLRGDAGDDNLSGGTGNDIVNGGLGADLLDGGDGVDRASYAGSAAVTVDLEIVGAQNTVGAGLDTLVSIEDLEGGSFNDILNGSAGANLILGGVGNDTIDGRGGNDILNGQIGNDTISGGLGEDLILGGDGIDTVFGGADNDQVFGEAGNDILNGDGGDDVIDGGAGNDFIYGGAGDDRGLGGVGNDTLNGDDGDDTLFGGAGVDTLNGGVGDDTLSGDDGADNLNGGDGADILYGGAAADILEGGAGRDTLVGGVGDDTLNGGDGGDILLGGIGSDKLSGGNGDDFLFGGLGKDTLTGGAGRDFFIFEDVSESTLLLRDTILDFSAEDVLDLTGIDANTGLAADQAFTIVTAFTGVAGELVLKIAGGNTTVTGDVDGDGVADFALLITGAVTDTSGFLL